MGSEMCIRDSTGAMLRWLGRTGRHRLASEGSPLPLRDRLHHLVPGWIRRCCRSLLFIPICVVVLIVLLGSLRLSGSSIGLVAENYPAQSAGIPRPNRSDEWRGRTPLVVRQAATDFASETDVGMGVHDTGVLSDLPVKTVGSVRCV